MSRAMALAAARKLLLERGPQAVTLKAVAAEIGRTHANLLHHFGSAAGLQAALARSTADRLNASIDEAVERARSGEADAREIVDRTFDAFGNEGAGALAAWMILTGNRDALDPVLESINGLVSQLTAGHAEERVAENTLGLVLSALGDSLLGGAVAEALGMPRDTARELAAERLRYRIAPKPDIDGSEAPPHNRSRNDAFARLQPHPPRRFGRAGELLLYRGGWDELTRD